MTTLRTRFLAPAALLLAGCGGGLFDETPMIVGADDDRVRVIDASDPAAWSREPPASPDDPGVRERERERFRRDLTPLARVDLDIAAVRAASLSHNLDLEVELVSPAIARTRTDEEEAKFEATFTASASYSDSEAPAALGTEGNNSKFTRIEPGLTVPLRTGGTLSFALPLSRSSTDNPFALLDPAISADASVRVSQPLLRNAGVETANHSILVARNQEAQSNLRTKVQAITVLAEADRAYWRLYAAQQALEVAVQQHQLAEVQVERARRRVEAGESPAIEVLRAESGLAQRIEAIIRADAARRRLQRDLKRIMNRPDLPMESEADVVLATDPAPRGLDLDADAVADLAEENRAELLEIEIQLLIDAASVRFQRNQKLPSVNLDASYASATLRDNYRDALTNLLPVEYDEWSIGVRGEIPLGNQAREAAYRAAVLQRVQTLATHEQRRIAIRQQVHDAVDQVRQTWQRILAAIQEEEVAQATFEAEQRQFEVGERTSTDVLDAATRLAEAQERRIAALTDHEIALIDLAVSTGTLLGKTSVRWQPRES